MACGSGCCGPAKASPISTPVNVEVSNDKEVEQLTAPSCVEPENPIQTLPTSRPSEEDKADDCNDDCCNPAVKEACTADDASSCCGSNSNSGDRSNTLKDENEPGERGCKDACCDDDTSDDDSSDDGCCTSKKNKDSHPQPPDDGDKCCSDEKKSNAKAPLPVGKGGGCCTEKKVSAGCGGGCCSEKKAMNETTKEITQTLTGRSDPERGLSGKEHVILSISGMTCTGCETKLSRTLSTLPAITRLKTSLVLSRAEFDLDTSMSSAEDVVKHLERTTEFKCERVTNNGSSIDFIVDNPIDYVKGDWPQGVLEMKAVDKKIIRVDFDPKVIGARDLSEKGWYNPMQLAPPQADPTLHAGARHVRNVGFATLVSIALTIPVLVLAWAPLSDKEAKKITHGSISLAFATIIQIAIAGPFYPKALKALVFSRVIEMDLLIVLSTSAAYIFSVIAFGYMVTSNPLSTGEFFETSTLLVTLIMVGRYIAALSRQKAVESISIRSLQATSATIIDTTGVEKDIDARLLQFGDVFKVSPEHKVPTDGTVIGGTSEVDESMLTGESRPVEKKKGSAVIAGSINGSGALTVRLGRVPGDNTISTIAGMVDEAKLSKPKVQEIADRVASYFVPVVISITIVVFCIWIAVGIAVQGKSGSEATVQAVTYAITVLIVSCPCAIGLAVPMVVVVATGVAAERGIIFKSSNAIEVAYKTAHVAFDKTGTLTQGKLSVVREEYLNPAVSTKSMLLGLIGSSKHPVSVAVANHLKGMDISPTTISNAKSVIGKGVEGSFAGRKLQAGNSRWLQLGEHSLVQSLAAEGYTVFCFTVNGEVAAVFGLEDSLREDAHETITKLQAKGISVHLVSGDDGGAVQKVASQLQIPSANVQSHCTPSDKQEYIKDLLSRRVGKGNKQPVVIFVGDGTNDAVALAQATIGVHMNEGTDVAQSAADIVLMRPNLAGVITAIAVSRKAMHRVAFNFGWSFVYNVFAILLAAGAFVHARIPPEFAGLGELVSVLPVVAAGVLLKWARF
ncbi:copper-translocating P-t [Aaosphaeria arxii CBS 175.79]|uniref:Copper-translocating P-t n=1 Tax=Aaosphaeria arxii CBS 175.79 TaxID=1450172 RepID=A0A6A5YAK9_9PLEO|nr:copper-translocating P-t [Aaosphaeria arxii CBS 175.79]KAF2022389.1 copper-translocating P-t [Aaosphaeria arxii CBS 175.79]